MSHGVIVESACFYLFHHLYLYLYHMKKSSKISQKFVL